MQVFDIGESRQLTSFWYDAEGDGVQPAQITLTVTHPNGAVDTFVKGDMTQGATVAEWSIFVTPDADGAWRYSFVGLVDNQNVAQGGVFIVGAGSAPTTGPCEPWASWDVVEACGPSSLADVSPMQREYAVDVASRSSTTCRVACIPASARSLDRCACRVERVFRQRVGASR